MSSVDKLLIRGIRSFSPYRENVIEFYAPLTIIVGHNGAGKTTVIECLKYATTGDLPPNSKGGAFVHDPKISGEVEVKGQIKLKFRNLRGQTMVVTRSLQSTQKRSKLEQKTLESLLVTNDPVTGEAVSLSSRCAELDAEIPLQLGVSQAVLESVLFCHQEESFWPLASEPSVLKKRFDEIFAATRYTRALDTLKSLKKELGSELRIEQQKLEHLKTERERAQRLCADRSAVEKRVEQTKEKIGLMEEEIGSVSLQVERLQVELKATELVRQEVDRAMHELRLAQENRTALLDGLSILTEPEETLRRQLEQLAQRTEQDEQAISSLREQKKEKESDLQSLSKRHSEGTTERALCLAETQRAKAAEEAANLVLVAYGSMADGTERLSSLRKAYALQEQQAKEEEQRQRQEEQVLNGRLSTLNETKRQKRKQREEAQRKLALLYSQIEQSDGAANQLEESSVRLLEEEEALRERKVFYEAAAFETRIAELTKQKAGIEQEAAEASSRLLCLNKSSDLRSRLQLKRTEQSQKKEGVARLLADLGVDLKPEEAEISIEQQWRAKERELRSFETTHEQKSSSLAAVSSRLAHGKAILKRKEQEAEQKEAKLQVIGNGDFGMLLEEQERQLEETTKRFGIALNSKETYEAFQQSFLTDKACPLCERGWESRMDEQLFAKRLAHLLASLPQQALEAGQQKRDLEERLKQLRLLRPLADDVDRLRLVELPELKREMALMDQEREKAELVLEELNSTLAQLRLDEKKLALMKRKAEDLGRVLRECNTVTREVDQLEREAALLNSHDSLDDLQLKLESLRANMNRLHVEIESLSREQSSRLNELQSRERAVHELKEQLLKLQLSQASLGRLQEQAAELEKSLKDVATELSLLEGELSALEEKLSQKNYLALREQLTADLLREHHLLEDLTKKHDQALLAEKEAQSQKQKILELLENEKDLETKLAEIEQLLRDKQEQINGITDHITLAGKQASEAMLQERTIRDNIRLREVSQRIELLQQKATTTIPLENPADLQRLLLRQNALMGERSGLFGEQRQLQDQIIRLARELSADYGQIDKMYTQQFVRVAASSAAIDDLEKYAKALDQAIMRFHAHRMAEINRIIKEIWTSTYQGADIDSIEIRCETGNPTEEGIVSTGTVGARSYNYRVVMIKGETELDMRGRSSAGQRVLASLIIRLALAETFGQQCGVLALDEPTTNLDRENIESLAASLAQ